MSKLPSVAAFRSSEPVHRPAGAQISYICRIAPNTLLCCGHLPRGLTGQETIHIDGIPAEKPYLAARLLEEEPPLTVLLLRIEEGYLLDSMNEVSFTYPAGHYHWYAEGGIDETGGDFIPFIEALKPADLSKLYYLLIKYSGVQSSAGGDDFFLRLCLECQHRLEEDAAAHAHACWLTPNTVYLEAYIPLRSYDQLRAVQVGASGLVATKADVAPLPVSQEGEEGVRLPVLLTFAPTAQSERPEGQVSLLLKDRLIPLAPLPPYIEPNAAGFIAHLRQLPESLRLNIRDFVNRQLMERATDATQEATANLVRNFQLYLPPSHSSVCDREQPFGLNIDAAYAIGREGFFLCGWMHDPLGMLKEMVLLSDLGFSARLEDKLIFFPREDVEEMYRDASFPPDNAAQGFVAYIECPATHRKKYLAWPQSFAFRVTAYLHGGLSYTVAPEPCLPSPFTLREKLLGKTMETLLGDSVPAIDALGKAARTVQEACVSQADVRQYYQFGQAVRKPTFSVIIPLYSNFDYIAAQVAHFAGDASMAGVEIIYVLDAPAEETRIKEQLRTLSLLYRLPLKLLVLTHNGGYAVASNLGAKVARGDYLLLMNSDILPTENGWLQAMFDAYNDAENPGALAPLLLYEDDGIQHAGMYFSLNPEGEHYENLHYFKGYPRTHAEAKKSRRVPAVSAACLLIRRTVFEKAGRFTTDYVIGDFEDSDLCLKLSKLGYAHYYLADVALYHFERQSFSKAAAADSVRYRINAREHHRRWKSYIGDIMEAFHG